MGRVKKTEHTGSEQRIQEYYRNHPWMVSSPFGGIDGIHSAMLEQVFKRFQINVERCAILDVGCGRGYLRDTVRVQGGDYTGADLVVSRSGLRMTVASAEALPFASGHFDGLFCLDAFEHFPHPERAISEFRRVLRPGGFALISVPHYGNVAGLVKWFYETIGWSARDTWAPFGRWQAQELERFTTAGGVSRQFRRGGFTPAGRMAHRAEAGLGLFPWIDHPRMPEALRYQAQRFFAALGPAIIALWPGASLHAFMKFTR